MDARRSLPVERASNFRQISPCLIELNNESGDELYRGFLPVVGVGGRCGRTHAHGHTRTS